MRLRALLSSICLASLGSASQAPVSQKATLQQTTPPRWRNLPTFHLGASCDGGPFGGGFMSHHFGGGSLLKFMVKHRLGPTEPPAESARTASPHRLPCQSKRLFAVELLHGQLLRDALVFLRLEDSSAAWRRGNPSGIGVAPLDFLHKLRGANTWQQALKHLLLPSWGPCTVPSKPLALHTTGASSHET